MSLKKCGFFGFYFVVIVVSGITVWFFKEYSAMITFFLMVGIPVLIAEKTPKELGYRNFFRGLVWGVGVSLLILPLYIIVCSKIENTFLLPSENFLNIVLFYLTVAVAEETFFRGYLYSEMENKPFIGSISKVNFVSSFLFATAHVLIYYNPVMFKVFFPSLVMGYLYERSDSILAPIIFHWISDVVYQFVYC